MPAYFFHIGFELYPSRSSPETTFTPPPGTNIFSKLPAHNTTPWSSWSTFAASPRNTNANANANANSSANKQSLLKTVASSSDVPLVARPAASRRFSHRARPSFTELRDSPVPAGKDKRPGHKRALSFAGPKDWRFDSVTIQSIDMESSGEEQGNVRPRAKSLKHPARGTMSGGLATKGVFVPSDLKDTEAGWGVVHLYRDGQETPGLYDDAAAAGDGTLFNEEECTTLCILAVPSYMTPSDFLGFVGEETREARANKYMVLMKFKEATRAREWRKEWNGKAFNSMEARPLSTWYLGHMLTKDGSPTLIELPTCPVCLERMDETTGLLTILCQHVFHCACLEKWRGSGCPVCRYTQHDAFATLHSGAAADDAENECSVCGSTSNLWICLICGNIGCGRYDEAHAFAHYETTSHTYAMDVVTQHVWDYAGDGYVHRLIQNKADGKLVDLPASTHRWGDKENGGGMTGYAADSVPREKLDNMGIEYAYLLTSQLESQRAYFEEQVERAVDKASKAASSADEAVREAKQLAGQLGEVKGRFEEVMGQLKELEREAERNKTRATTATALSRKLTQQVKEEQTVNESLLTRIAFLEKKAQDAEKKAMDIEAEKKDLEEQNRDLSFFISGQEKLKEMQGNEIMGLEEGGEEGEGGKEDERGKWKRNNVEKKKGRRKRRKRPIQA
ncbi:zf-UBP-domain-containing protein [Amniculicola lignicola CBS 123094]|uniref:Zf-UBP-domain-containing protein n=1 Tax=Amniculicola lignicola CBS 123094 TaxID=1392246 RepID=A0A6A5WDU7_9PLEO|nr:zf-UBP-domain-containing protein [Amniculicola lignicola CBS 123094]